MCGDVSVARDSASVRARLDKLAAPLVRTVPKTELLKACQGQASVAAACECLAKTAVTWGGSAGLGPGASCEATEPPGKVGQVVSVWSRAGDSDTFAPGRALVLVAKTAGTWSALQVVESSDDVDLLERPQATDVASMSSYEELPYRGGTLLWLQTESEFSEWSVGEQDVRGKAGLTMCWLPGDGGEEAPMCAALPVAEWDFSSTTDRNGDDDRCETRTATHYRIAAGANGVITVVLERGTDEKKLVGRYRL